MVVETAAAGQSRDRRQPPNQHGMMQGVVFASPALCAEVRSPRVEQENRMPSTIRACGSTFLERSCDLRRSSDAVRELPHEGEQAFRLLDLRKVAGFWDELEARVRERLGIDTTILREYHAITLSPNNEDRDAHAPEPPPQLWITHALPLIIDIECPKVGGAGLDLFRAHGRRVDAEGSRVVEAKGGEFIRSQ